MAMTRPPVEVRPFDPLALPEGIPLQAFTNLGTGPAMDFTGRPVDLMQREHSRRLAEMEAFRPEQEDYSQEQADFEASRGAQDAYLAAIEQILADQAQYSQMLAQRETAGVPLNQMAGLFGPIRQRAGLPAQATPRANVRRVFLPDGEPILDEVEVDDGMSFKEAFRAARKADASIFHWRGKQYSTKVK